MNKLYGYQSIENMFIQYYPIKKNIIVLHILSIVDRKNNDA